MLKKYHLFVALFVTAILFGCIGLFTDMVYCLNDDLMIQSILSGSLSGTPGGLAVYLNVPLSSLLACLYRIFPQIPWLGVFLAGCYILCFFLIVYAMLESLREAGKNKTLVFATVALGSMVFLGFFGGQYLVMHYTVAAAVVGGTALFLFLLSEESSDLKETLRSTWPSVVLLWLCYLIRTQVFFMVLPFLAAAGLYRMIRTKSIVNYLLPLGSLGAGVLLFLLMGRVSYGSAAWQEYLDYNDARTELYDYALVWEGQEAMDYYAGQGYSAEEMAICRDYNVLLNEKLKAEDFRRMSGYADLLPEGQRSMGQKLRDGLWSYRNRMLRGKDDFPYNGVVIFLYMMVFMLFLAAKDRASILALAFLGVARSVLWVYLLMQGRFPERVMVSLYLVELAVLFAFAWDAVRRVKIYPKICTGIAAALMVALCVGAGGRILSDISEKQEEQLAINREEDQVYAYMAAHPENRYLLDVYATVDRTEYVLKGYDGSYENYLLLGGWSAGTPYVADKLAAWGYTGAFEALAQGENVCLVLKSGVGMRIEELARYYAWRTGEDVGFDCIETIDTGRGTFEIYQKKTD